MRKLDQNTSPLVSVAPMIDWTDRHCRFFHRLLSPHALLYTEMITTGAILHGDADRHLAFSPQEHPVVLQLGGSDPADLAAAAKIGEDYGYDQINLNCGCPSDRVQKGKFGACLMAEPDLVAECIAAMTAAVNIPVTVKCRIGIDDSAEFDFLNVFVEKVSISHCNTFIIHARKAWLKGLSPKENREIPPLRYDIARKIKGSYPHLNIILNGGIKNKEQVIENINIFDGVMIGREAYQSPYFLAELEHHFWGTPLPSRFDIARRMILYITDHMTTRSGTAHQVTRHMLGLFNGIRGAKHFRQVLGGDSLKVREIQEVTPLIENALSRMQDI